MNWSLHVSQEHHQRKDQHTDNVTKEMCGEGGEEIWWLCCDMCPQCCLSVGIWMRGHICLSVFVGVCQMAAWLCGKAIIFLRILFYQR